MISEDEAMLTHLTVTDRSIQIIPRRRILWLLTGGGILLLILGTLIFLRLYDTHQEVGHFSLGIGLLAALVGLFGLVRLDDTHIIFNEPKGFYRIQASGKGNSTALVPITYFDRVRVDPHLQHAGRWKGLIPYEVILANDRGSSVFLGQFRDVSKSVRLAERIQEITGLDIYWAGGSRNGSNGGANGGSNGGSDDGSLIGSRSGSHHGLYKKGKVQVIVSEDSQSFRFPQRSNIRSRKKDKTRILSWRRRSPLLAYVLWAGALYGCFHFLYMIFLAKGTPSLWVLSGYGLLLLSLGIFFIVSLLQEAGLNRLHLTPEKIAYDKLLLGKTLHRGEISRKNISTIRNSLDGTDGRLCILSKEGKDMMESLTAHMAANRKHRLDSIMLERLDRIGKHQIQVDISSLSASDRILLEQFIWKR